MVCTTVENEQFEGSITSSCVEGLRTRSHGEEKKMGKDMKYQGYPCAVGNCMMFKVVTIDGLFCVQF